MKISTKDFCDQHEACVNGRKWALTIGDDMAVVWDAMITESRLDWLLWTATRQGVFPSSTLRLLACRFARETPLEDGRTVWDLLTDPRSRAVIEIAERHARGKATDSELAAARSAAWTAVWDAAAYVARVSARDAALAAAGTAAWAEARAGAGAVAAQLRMIADLGNPFN